MILERLPEVTFARALAFNNLVTASNPVARLAEMSRTPAEPTGDRAAELALVVDEISAMSIALRDACANLDCGTARTNKLFWLKFLGFLLLLVAVLKTAKVGNFTFEALVIGTLKHGEVLKIIVVKVVYV